MHKIDVPSSFYFVFHNILTIVMGKTSSECKIILSIFFFLEIIFFESHISTSFHHKVRLLSPCHFKVTHSIHGATTFIVWSSFELMSHYNEDCFTRDLHLNVSNALISSMWNYLKLRFNKIGEKSSKQCNESVLTNPLNYFGIHLKDFLKVQNCYFYKKEKVSLISNQGLYA